MPTIELTQRALGLLFMPLHEPEAQISSGVGPLGSDSYSSTYLSTYLPPSSPPTGVSERQASGFARP